MSAFTSTCQDLPLTKIETSLAFDEPFQEITTCDHLSGGKGLLVIILMASIGQLLINCTESSSAFLDQNVKTTIFALVQRGGNRGNVVVTQARRLDP